MAFIGQLTGNLGRDPELKFIEINGQARQVVEFSVAVRLPRRQGVEQPARWVKCSAWGKTAELIADILRKGDKVFLIGRVEAPEYFKRQDGTQGLAEKFTVEAFEKVADAALSRQQALANPQGVAPAAPTAPVAPAAPTAPTASAAPARPAASGWDTPPYQQQSPVAAPQAMPPGGFEDPPF